jgi:next-to-BRCA1 protein 1
LGDQHSKQHPPKIDADEAAFANAVTQVQAYLDMKPTEEKQAKTPKEKIQIRDLLAEPVQEKITLNNRDSVAATAPAPVEAPKKVAVPVTETPKKDTNELDAHFIRDTIKDGSHIAAGMTFVQVWTLRNPGPNAWPAGCSVRHVGGDNMLNLDNTRPLSQSELAEASESNVVGRPVEAGEEISFRVLMKAPSREGTAISYWRLKTADGMGFGHRLWCDIQVVAPPSPSVLPSAHPVLTENGAPTYPGIDRNVMGGNQRMEQGPPKMLKERELEHMLHVQQVRRAAVMRILDARHKAQELALQHAEASASAEGAKRDAKQDSAELPVEEKAVEAQTEAESSGMIFPQLEKESPESSTHEALSDKSESGEDKPGSTTVVASEQSDEEFFEDAESVDIRSFSGDDDEAFMTDEEYDILNASDEEAT